MRFLKITVLIFFIAFSAACYFFSVQKHSPIKNPHHSKTLRPANTENVKGDFERENRFEYAGVKVEMSKIGQDFFISFENQEKYRIKAVVGDKKIEQYVAEKEGKLIRLPVAFDLIEKSWINLNETFFEPENSDFFKYQKDWQTNCSSCHLEESAQIDAQKQSDCASCHSKPLHETENFAIRLSAREHQGILRSVCFTKTKGGEIINCLSCHSAENPSKRDEKILSQTACTACHQQFSFPEAIAEHTKHQINSANCYSCHQPEIAYGHLKFQKTHEISIPNPELTAAKEIPNACNLCHADKSVNWAILESKKLWAEHFRDAKISNDSQFDQPEAIRALFAGNAFSRALAINSLSQNSNLNWFAPFAFEAFENENYPLVRYFLENLIRKNQNFQINPVDRKRAQSIAEKLRSKRTNPDLYVSE